ncbi:conserved Plasmodium protein, unknown function [Plasmodium malariae]|uniref:Transmembrane protein n=2 Tax=Plasmodium (Plasmodium) TaxID=418103 RepID=A0A1C3KAN6_PLAMA|nr:conserved Plasmodium protein, unknown function [Plasmodium malariae]SBT70528.1 conserved Plasmodium protein, unknown function [Plasmodium malariae]SBT86455.1 conserved Plasmodium protein, unknown function [Plasmodium malariae]
MLLSLCKIKDFSSFSFKGVRCLSSKKISNYYTPQRPSVKDMDDEYKKFLEIKRKENNNIPEFKITNIDINTFKKYKHKNNPIFSTEFKVFITGFLLCSWCVFAIYLTVRIMSPDDFDWVEQERKRLENAKKKIMSIKEKEKEMDQVSNTG